MKENQDAINHNKIFPNKVYGLLNIDEIYIEKLIELINNKKFDSDYCLYH